MVRKRRYTFSFTGASALLAETMVIAEQYYLVQDWDKIKVIIQENNLINKIKQSTLKRKFQEIKKRLQLLTADQLALLINGSPEEAKAMLLLSLLKTYSFFKDFVIEVIRSKYLLYVNILTESDYISFFNSKALTHTELNSISEQTANKVKQVLFRMLEQVGIINSAKDGIIIKPFLSDDAIAVIINDNASWLSGFLFADVEIKTVKKSSVHG